MSRQSGGSFITGNRIAHCASTLPITAFSSTAVSLANNQAGGYDALFLIAIDQPIVLQSLQDEVWSRWTELKVSPLLARQSDGGMRVEVAREVRGLGEAVWGCLAKRNNEA